MIDPKELLSLDTMVTPKLMTILYWIVLAIIVLIGLRSMNFIGIFPSIIFIAVAAIFTRISFERTIVAFKSNEYLKKIAEKE